MLKNCVLLLLVLTLLIAGCTQPESPATPAAGKSPVASATPPAGVPGHEGTATPPAEVPGHGTMPTPHEIPANESGAMEGTVQGLQDNVLLVKKTGGMEFRIQVGEDTQIRPEGKLSDLKPGTPVKVEFKYEENRLEAQSIEVQRGGSTATPEAGSTGTPETL
ncbi:MAG: hypothetical protein HY319_04785 [Armatimonadetes bacterium]|nr:hypothetical protein [Armatimonadota bacterium]